LNGGWIRLEKDLRGDPRVQRMGRALAKRYELRHQGNACALPGVTLVLGGLTQLWMHADSFARDDDTLDMSVDEIDELTGIKGFAEILPADWFEIINEQCVKLPGFQEHNGTEAKRKALTAKRVARHRNKVQLDSVTSSNAVALPDQTKTRPIPDQTTKKIARAARLPLDVPGLNPQAWDRWSKYRTEIRKPIKPASIEEAQRALAAFGADQVAVVAQSIAHSWQGLFPLKGSPASPAAVVQRWTPEEGNDETAEEGYRAHA
jgi:hypothetical protein